MSSDALIQIVDNDDNPVGTASIKEAQEKGLIQQISRVMVSDEDGNILLQKRAASRRLFPGRWDNSAAGHVDAGEDYLQAARRETKEEIGLDNLKLQEIGYFYTSFKFQDMKLNQFQKVYKVELPASTEFKLDSEEVSEVKWFSLLDLKALVDSDPDSLTVGLRETIKRLY